MHQIVIHTAQAIIVKRKIIQAASVLLLKLLPFALTAFVGVVGLDVLQTVRHVQLEPVGLLEVELLRCYSHDCWVDLDNV